MIKKLDDAREAFKYNDIKASQVAHAQHQSHGAHEHHSQAGEFLKSAIYGGLDGIITTFSVIVGCYASGLGLNVILIFGISTMLADAISMAFGDYLGTVSEIEYFKTQAQIQKQQLKDDPESQEKELIEIYEKKGVPIEDSISMIKIYKKYDDAYLKLLLAEIKGVNPIDEDPVLNGVITFAAFILCGVVSLIPCIFASIYDYNDIDTIFIIATGLSILTCFILGSTKSKFTNQSWFCSSIETVIIFCIASLVSYLVGVLMRPLLK